MYDLWANAPFVERSSVLQWNYTGDALGILHYAVGDAGAFERAIADLPQVLEYELLSVGEDRFYVYIRDATTAALDDLFGPITDGGLVVVPPIRYLEDGSVTFSLFGPDAEIQAAVEAVPSLLDVTVESVGGLGRTVQSAEWALSPRQREAVAAAVDLGYYEVPRTADHEAVARAINCAPSTAAEHLQKAEANLVTTLIEQ